MVITLVVPVRVAFGLHDVITARHLDRLAKLMLATGLIVAYSYGIELFAAWYGADPHERYTRFHQLPRGDYAWLFWTLVVCNVLVPQLLWSARARRSAAALFGVSILVNVGMWSERFVIVVGSLSRDFLPSSWRPYAPTWVDLGILAGTISLFVFLFLSFLRFVPIVSASEVKELAGEAAP